MGMALKGHPTNTYSWLKNTPALWEMYFNSGSVCKNIKMFVCIANTSWPYPKLTGTITEALLLVPFLFLLLLVLGFFSPFPSCHLRLILESFFTSSHPFLYFFLPLFCLFAVTERAHLAPCTWTDGTVFNIFSNEYFFLFFNYINLLQSI